ncbi:MAG: phosphoribosylformylglycinamidine synthase, partial [Thermococcus sp.]|nr:phosphoribosylformylglycinamidine synthase [Thermococcus sp.]
GNPSHSYLNPYHGAVGAVAEVVRNLASVGAKPLALVDNLNFASPERPEVYWSFIETIKGLADGAKAFGLAYVSGNVSFYNEVGNKPIKPTPVVAGLGKVKLENLMTMDFKDEGDLIAIVGVTKKELGGSELYRVLNINGGIAPRVDLEREKRNAEGILKAIELRVVKAVHDVSKGGIAVALAEMALSGGIGFEVDISKVPVEEKLKPVEVMFSESHGRFVISFEEEKLEKVAELFEEFAVIGRVRGNKLIFKNRGEEITSINLEKAQELYNSLPRLLGE